MLHILDEILEIFSFIRIAIQFISKKLTKLILIYGGSELVRSFFSRNNKFKLICMSEHNPIEMFNFLLLSHLETINKDLCLGFWNDVKLFSLLQDGAMSFIDTKRIDFNVVLFDLICTNVCFSLFKFIK